ncbi:response regulator [Paenibacillus sp. HJGM_3]|uniref:response regulator n=1 Tax=Paenibacillus sp. HJGM_3 TaxID=3379816 RepID=UPI00385F3712
MKRILIVDDEAMTRQHIRTQFPWQEWGYVIAGEAENGVQALERCRKLKPDILLLDITMPLMGGLELLERLKVEFPLIRCIILTAHRDFSYAQEAIRKGADGYILKAPIDAGEMRSALQRASDEFDKTSRLKISEQSHKVLVHNYQYPLRQKFFEDIQSSLLAKNEEIIALGEKLGIDLGRPSYILLDCCVDELPKLEHRYPVKDRSLIEFSLLEIVRECVQMDFPGSFELFPVTFGRFVLLLTGQRTANAPLLKENITLLLRKLSKPLGQYLKIRLTVTGSRPFTTISLLNQVYRDTLKYRNRHFYSDRSEPLFVDQAVPFRPIPSAVLKKLEDRVEEIVCCQDEQPYGDWTGLIKKEFLFYKPEPASALQWLENLLCLLTENTAALGVQPFASGSLQGETSFSRALEAVARQVNERRKRQSHSLQLRHELSAAVQYIKNHLSDDLNVEIIAHKVKLSPSYLGQLFKKEVGVSIVDYILEQRMEMAKHYLLTGQYRNYELASKVGFRSYSYFCTLFKKYYGVTPNEYKHAHQPVVEP